MWLSKVSMAAVAFSGKQHLLFFCQISPLLYLLPPFLSSMFWKQHLLFFAKSPLSSPLLCFADDEIVQVHTLYGIWADDQELVRNLASLAAAPTLPSPLFSVMMPWCSKFKIRWWLTCFWGLYHCYFSFFYILLFYRTTLVYRPFLFLIPSRVPKAHFLASIRTKREIMSRTPDSATRCPEHDEQPTYKEQALED